MIWALHTAYISLNPQRYITMLYQRSASVEIGIRMYKGVEYRYSTNGKKLKLQRDGMKIKDDNPTIILARSK